jgi:hypothetical protein
LETRQKALLAQHNIEHSPARKPMDFPPPPTFYNPWECWGCPKIWMRPPNTRRRKASTFKYTDDARGDKESPKDCSNIKSCDRAYTCPRAPFYREMKGHLHSKSTFESMEYS